MLPHQNLQQQHNNDVFEINNEQLDFANLQNEDRLRLQNGFVPTDAKDTRNIVAAHKDAWKKLPKALSAEEKVQLKTTNNELVNKLSIKTTTETQEALSFEERNKTRRSVIENQTQLLDQDSKWYSKDSKSMQQVKEKVNTIYNLMKAELPKREGGELGVNPSAVKEQYSKAYDDAIKACNDYIDSHKNPWFAAGIRRKQKVMALYENLREEKALIIQATEMMKSGAFGEQIDNIKTGSDLLLQMHSIKISESKMEREGNTTTVYRLKDKDGNEYYMKENLPLISNELGSYLDRRIKQVKSNIGSDTKEQRLEKLSDKELKSDMKVMQYMLKKLTVNPNGSGDDKVTQSDKIATEKRYLKFLGHDFNKFYERLSEYNEFVKFSKSVKIRIQEAASSGGAIDPAMIEETRNKLRSLEAEEKKDDGAIAYVKMLLRTMENPQNAPAAGGQVAVEEKADKKFDDLKELTEKDWLLKNIKDLGLDKKKDSELINKLVELCDDHADKKLGLRRLLLRTMGKDAELYGQMTENSGVINKGDNEEVVVATNNTATWRIAKQFGFQDVITSSQSSVVKMKLAGSEKEEDVNCTLMSVAPGLEMLKLVELAQKSGAKLQYSPNAVRQLMRLQMLDTVCLQTDRHWRNFKCKTEPDITDLIENDPNSQEALEKLKNAGSIKIVSIMSYDHDQAFSKDKGIEKKDFEQTGADGKKIAKKNGFLPPIFTNIEENSTQFDYLEDKSGTKPVRKKYVPKILDEAPIEKVGEPVIREKYKKEHEWKCTFGLYSINTNETDMDPFNDSALYSNFFRDLTQHTDVYKQLFSMAAGIKQDDKAKINSCFDTFIKYRESENVDQRADAFLALQDLKDIYDRCVAKNSDAFVKVDSDKKSKECMVPLQVKNLLSQEKRNKLKFANAGSPVGTVTIDNLQGGEFDFKMQMIFYRTSTFIKNDLQVQKVLRNKIRLREGKEPTLDEKEFEAAEDKRIAEINKKRARLKGDVPTLLHMDKAAYESIKNMKDTWKTQEAILLDLKWDTERIEAMKKRIDSYLDQIEQARKIAEPWLKDRYKDANDPRAKFFLDEKDYDKFEDITEFAWDPGMSYLCNEDENYLLAEEDYSKRFSSEQQKAIVDKVNKQRKNSPRLHDIAPEEEAKKEGGKWTKPKYKSLINGKLAK